MSPDRRPPPSLGKDHLGKSIEIHRPHAEGYAKHPKPDSELGPPEAISNTGSHGATKSEIKGARLFFGTTMGVCAVITLGVIASAIHDGKDAGSPGHKPSHQPHSSAPAVPGQEGTPIPLGWPTNGSWQNGNSYLGGETILFPNNKFFSRNPDGTWSPSFNSILDFPEKTHYFDLGKVRQALPDTIVFNNNGKECIIFVEQPADTVGSKSKEKKYCVTKPHTTSEFVPPRSGEKSPITSFVVFNSISSRAPLALAA